MNIFIEEMNISLKLIGSTELQNRFNENVHFFEAAFHLTLVKKNPQNGERRKKYGYLLEKAEL